MANGLYLAYRQGIIGAHATRVDWDADTFRTSFVDTGTYTVALTTHAFYSSLSGVYPNTRATGKALTSPTIGTLGAGIADAADTLFAAFSNGAVSEEGIVIYKDSGTDATSDLVAWWDTGVTGMPFTPSGGDVTIAWSSSGIFQI